MGTKEEYLRELSPLVEGFPKSGGGKRVGGYLAGNSNLPGPRANLELAEAFATVVAAAGSKRPAETWDLCSSLAGLSSSRAPQNTPQEFVAFCGVRGLGALGAAHGIFLTKAMRELKKHSQDERWRVREAVAASLQRLLLSSPKEVLRELGGWIDNEDWLRMRAVVAGIAEPALMKDSNLAEAGLKMHKVVMKKVLRTKDRRSSEFKALRQALGYSLSVVAVAQPQESFAYLEELSVSHDPDVVWIVKENLKKDRLRKNFPTDVAELERVLENISKKPRLTDAHSRAA